MNTVSRLCTLALCLGLTPLAQAQEAQTKPAPSNPPQAESTAPAPAPTQREKVGKEVEDAVDAIRGYSVERRDEAAERARQSMSELDGRIEALQMHTQQGWARMSEATRTRSETTMNGLRDRRNKLAEWYGGMRHSSVDAWGEVKSGFVTSYHDLADAMRKAREQFDQEQSDEARNPETSRDK